MMPCRHPGKWRGGSHEPRNAGSLWELNVAGDRVSPRGSEGISPADTPTQ